jgi:hypothetical protein
MVSERIQFPEMVINGIAENPDGLIGTCPSRGKDRFEARPVQTTNLLVGQDEPGIIPIDEIITQRIDVETDDSPSHYKDDEHPEPKG